MASVEHSSGRILEIMKQVISQLRDAKDVADLDISALLRVGYTEAEISTAVSWLVDSMQHTLAVRLKNEDGTKTRVQFRSLHPAERHLFSPEAWGELIQMQSLGMINAQQIELLVERCVVSSLTNLDKESLHVMVADILFREHPKHNGKWLFLPENSSIH